MLRYCRRAMPLLDNLERRFGFLAIPGLIRIVIVFTALVWGLMWLNPNFGSALDLDPARILHGEVWRLVTYIFIPRGIGTSGAMQPLWVVLFLWFLWFIGEGLEQAWGAFRLTLYFIVGMIGTTVAAVLFGARFSNSILVRVVVFRFRAILSRSGHLSFLYLAGENQVDRMGLGSILITRLCCRHEFLSDGAGSCPGQLFDLFRTKIIHDARHRGEVTARKKRYAQSLEPKPNRFINARSAARPN